jgi:hypothetical protein
MATRYYGSELRPNSGKRILGPGAQASQCPFATSANNTPYGGAGSPAVARSPGPMQHRPSSSRVPWAVDADRSGGRNTQGYIVPANFMRKNAGEMRPAHLGKSSAAPFHTDRQDEVNVPVTRTLESSFPRKRPQSAGAARAHASSSPGGPFGTELNSIAPPSPQPRAPRPGVDSATAPWLNPANQYDQVKSHSGKRIAVDTYVRPETARERRQNYGRELLAQIKGREQAKATAMAATINTEQRLSTMHTTSGLTRGIGERKPWL